MRRRVVLLIGLLLLALLPGCGRNLRPEEARELVRRVQQARRSTTLEGRLDTAVRLRQGMLSAQALMRRGPGSIQLQYLSGRFAGWRVIEQDGLVWRIDPQGKPHSSAFGADPTSLGLGPGRDLAVHYDGRGRTAGRRALRYTVRPPGSDKSRVQLALDAATYYPLAMQRYGPGGQLITSTTYTQINYQAAPPQRIAVPTVAAPMGAAAHRRVRPATEKQVLELLGQPILRPSYLPSNFQPRGMFIQSFPRRQVAELRYSDGLRSLTIMEAKAPERRGGQRHGQGQGLQKQPWQGWRERQGEGQPGVGKGAGAGPWHWWRGQSRNGLVRDRRGSLIVIVAGELPTEELRKVLSGIPYPPGEAPAARF